MSGESSKPPVRKSQPGLEGLESRALMSANVYNPKGERIALNDVSRYKIQSQTPVPVSDRRLEYTTPQGSHVIVTLYGAGSLKGSFVEPDGSLNLRFSGTNESSEIVGKITGGTGQAPLRSLTHLLVTKDSLSGIGSSVLYGVNLKNFDLLDNGIINMTGGVHTLLLNSVGRNTQVSLRELPASLLPGASGSATENGVTLGFLVDFTGARTLTTVGGQFVSGFGLLATTSVQHPNTKFAPAGLVAVINHVNGLSSGVAGLGDPAVFGYDPTTNALIRFDVATGNPDLTIPNALPVATPSAGVANGRINGVLVTLLSDGHNVYVFNPLDGTKLGSFSVANLAASGLVNPTRLGTVDSVTVIGDPNATAGTTGGATGLLQAINVGASLAAGQAVTVGTTFAAQNGLGLSGGFTGLPGLSTLYTAVGAHFNQYQPLQNQLGVASLALSNGGFTESSRTAVTNQGTTVNTNAQGGIPGVSPNNAVSAFDLAIGVDTGLGTSATGVPGNTISLYNGTSFAQSGTVQLNDANLLSGISSVFRPNLAGSALIDVQGDVQSVRINDAKGLVLNDSGNLNLAKIHNAVDSTIVGYPFGHAEIPNRTNVTIISSTRTVAGRNGVTVIPNIKPTGPLTLP